MHLGVLTNTQLNMSQQWPKNANGILACMRNIAASRSTELITPLYSTMVRPHLEYSVLRFGPHTIRKIMRPWSVSREGQQS